MFNIYYINYPKAFEISMLIDNHILEKIMNENVLQGDAEASISASSKKLGDIPVVGRFMPTAEFDGSISGAKSKKVIDNINVVSTKSTILNPILEKSIEVKKLSENSIGNLIKIRGVSLKVENSEDILSSKTLLSGLLNQIPVDGIGEMNITGLFEVFLKDSAYILIGETPRRFTGTEKIAIKIPIQAENELESQYSISDLEIGQVSIVGIYRGKYKTCDIIKKIDVMQKLQGISNKKASEIETDIQQFEDQNNSDLIHFIDIIAIIQEVNIK